MALRENLEGVSKDLAKILQQLKDIGAEQEKISKTGVPNAGVTATAGAGGVGGRTSMGTPNATFSTPPPATGSRLGGITSTSSSSMQVGTDPGTQSSMPGWARAAAITGAAAVTYGYNVTPGVADVYAHQQMKFRASFLGNGSYGYSSDYYNKVRNVFGNMQTDPFAMMSAANIATMTGQGMGTGNFNRMMRETAVTSTIFGQDTVTAATAQASMNSGSMAGRLATVGIFVSDLNTGNSKGFGNLVDQIWRVHYGSPTRKVPYESVAASIRGGNIGAFLNRYFGDAPELRDQITQALLMKAKNQGASMDYLDLGTYGEGAKQMGGRRGSQSAMNVAVGMGLVPENQPGLTNQALQSSRGNNMDSTADATLAGYRASAYTATNINELINSITSSGNGLVNFLLSLKGALDAFQNLGELSPILGLFGGLFGGLVRAGGGPIYASKGTSTSDSVSARLSKGEYVINARAAQMIGKQQLDAMNSMGHAFGSGFASPTKFFSGGGMVGPDELGYTKPTVMGTVADDRGGYVTAGEATLDRWSTLLYGDPALKSFPVSGSTLSLSLLERDGIGQYMADFAAAWQADPTLGQKRLNLSRGSSGGHQPRTTGHGGVSNHAAGVAMDFRYDVLTAHDGDTWQTTDAENAAIRRLLQRFSKLEWGGEWSGGMLDEMHFEIRDPKTWGKGGGSATGGTGAAAPTTPKKASTTETPSGVMQSIGFGGVMQPRGIKPTVQSVASYSGGATPITRSRTGSISWINSPLFSAMSGGIGSARSSSSSSSTSGRKKTGTNGKSNIDVTGNYAAGSGPKWLYDFLVSKGLRGNDLHIAWVLGMRESGGDPSNTTNGGSENWGYSGEPHYDVGLFQINNSHLENLRGVFGRDADMSLMLDANKNFEYMLHLSNNFKNLTAWGLNPDGQSFNWSQYPADWLSRYQAPTESNHAALWSEYNKYNTNNYSEGAYRTHEGMAKLHEGEMVLPATVAEEFRKVMREASGPGSSSRQQVNINLTIAKATDAEAERFARVVKKYLDSGDWEASLRSR